MSATTSMPINARPDKSTTSGRLFFLDLGAGRVLSANPDGSDLKTLISEGRKLPDGLVVDAAAGHIYWTNMGNPKKNDGSILRSDLDGKNMITIVPPGGTFTPKQLQTGKEERQALLVRPRRHASDAGQPGRVENRDSRGHEPRRSTSRTGRDEMVCRHRRRTLRAARFIGPRKAMTTPVEGRIFRANIEIPPGSVTCESHGH